MPWMAYLGKQRTLLQGIASALDLLEPTREVIWSQASRFGGSQIFYKLYNLGHFLVVLIWKNAWKGVIRWNFQHKSMATLGVTTRAIEGIVLRKIFHPLWPFLARPHTFLFLFACFCVKKKSVPFYVLLLWRSSTHTANQAPNSVTSNLACSITYQTRGYHIMDHLFFNCNITYPATWPAMVCG